MNVAGQRYQARYYLLDSWGAQRVLLSAWVLRQAVRLDAGKMRDMLQEYLIDANDRLLVTELAGDNWASSNAMVDINSI